MYGFVHAVVGANLGEIAGGPATAAALGMASHAALDVFPHHDYGTVTPGVVDVLLTVGLAGFLGMTHGPASPLLWGAVGGFLPDLEVMLSFLGKWPWPMLFPTHNGLLPHNQTGLARGFPLQALLALIGLWGLLH